VNLANWLYRAMDFNEDGSPESFGLQIKTVVVSDSIKVYPSREQENQAKVNSYNIVLMEPGTVRKKRESSGNNTDSATTSHFKEFEVENELFLEQTEFDYPETYNVTEPETLPENSDYVEFDQTTFKSQRADFGKTIYTLQAKKAYQDISKALEGDDRFAGCCAVMAFLYHDLTPLMSVSNHRKSSINCLVRKNRSCHFNGFYFVKVERVRNGATSL
jgi:hypothetical protein